jgi:hypothetical protein
MGYHLVYRVPHDYRAQRCASRPPLVTAPVSHRGPTRGGRASSREQPCFVVLAAVVVAALLAACTSAASATSPASTLLPSSSVALGTPLPASISPVVSTLAPDAAATVPTPTAPPSPVPAAREPAAPPSPSPIHAAALRTFLVAEGQTACPQFILANAVRGVLEGSPSDPREPIWLRSSTGARISVIWPAGFSVRFDPDAVLYNEHSRPVAKAGSTVVLPQVASGSRAGTFEDPYVASGLLFGSCYQPAT